MKKTLIFLSCLACINYGYSQSLNGEFDYIKFGDNQHLLIGLDLSPNGQYLAVSSLKGRPLIVYDWSKRETIKEFSVGDWYGGSSIKYSPNGKYLLLQKLFYNDFAENKDNEVDFELIDAASGSLLKLLHNYHTVAFTPDTKFIVSLTGEEIAFWDLNTLKKEKVIKINSASNSFAFDPNGKYIAVSHYIYDFETGNILFRIDLASRMFERVDGELVGTDTRAAFVFLPDNKKVVITHGNRLLFWDLEYETQ